MWYALGIYASLWVGFIAGMMYEQRQWAKWLKGKQ